jgi:NADPH2:quinone reductase
VVLESVGGELFRSCLRAIAWEGRLVVIGFAAGEIPTVKAGHVLVKNMDLIGLQSSDYRGRDPKSFREAQGVLLDLLASGKIGVHVSATYPLEAAAEALEDIREGRVRGKVVLTAGRTA